MDEASKNSCPSNPVPAEFEKEGAIGVPPPFSVSMSGSSSYTHAWVYDLGTCIRWRGGYGQ